MGWPTVCLFKINVNMFLLKRFPISYFLSNLARHNAFMAS